MAVTPPTGSERSDGGTGSVNTTMFGAHLTHQFIQADDVLECAVCMVRIYNDEAKLPCPQGDSK